MDFAYKFPVVRGIQAGREYIHSYDPYANVRKVISKRG